MSSARDRLNAAGLLKLLGHAAPPREAPQPLAVAAAGAGGGGSAPGLTTWARSVILDGVELTSGRAYYLNGSAWSVLTPAVNTRAAIAVCTSVVTDPTSQSTLILAGEFPHSGTDGASLYASDSGVISETFPGNANSESTAAPWVWPIAWQYSGTLAILMPCDPYRPRKIKYCLADGETQLELVMREYPADPA